MKDPAFLFYPNDWLGGTMILTRHQKGCYMDLLMAQFNTGPLSLEAIKVLLGEDFKTWPALQHKFKKDNNDCFFNERLEIEKMKRKDYSLSRSKNRNAGKTPAEKAVITDCKPEDKKLQYKPHVLLKEAEYEKLCTDFGNRSANAAIEFLHLYKQEKNYTTKSDYLSIRRWVIDAVNKTKKHDKRKPIDYIIATDGTKLYEKDIDFSQLGK